MKKINRLVSVLAALCLVLAFMPTVVFAADADGDGYNDNDVAIVRQIIEASPTLSAHYDVNNPAEWVSNVNTNLNFVWWAYGEGGELTVQDLQLGYMDGEDWKSVTDYKGTLDLSGMTNLKMVDCSNNTELTSLILPDTVYYIICRNTGITELDISKYAGLEVLYCGDTPITSLDVSKNTILNILFAYNTGITDLDVSALADLQELNCSNTKITELDVSKNLMLEYLDCSHTDIAELDVSKIRRFYL